MRFGLKILLLAAFVSPWTHSAAAALPPLVILMPGGAGAPRPAGFLIRNRQEFERAGFQTHISSTAQETIRAARNAKERGQKVFLVGISIGVSKAASAIQAGAPIDAAVFFSGAYRMALRLLGSPNSLPPTLMVHHRKDRCPVTTPGSADEFKRWAHGKVVKLVWIDSSGDEWQFPCGPKGAHGFFRKDREPISAAIAFLRR